MREENMKQKLAVAVRSVQWSYAIFWSPSPQQSGILEWGDGYYNGGIKTRKTIQSMDIIKADDQTISQRSDQLRELYLSLLTGNNNNNNNNDKKNNENRRPLAALSPEDLTDVEWFYLVCMSFVFNIGQGLPGSTLASGRTIWLSNAHCVDTRVFTRSLLAKSAGVQTVVCFPYLAGVVELGTTDLVKEDITLIQHIRASLDNSPPPPQPSFSPNVQAHNVELLSPCGSSIGGVELPQPITDLYMFEGLRVLEDHNIFNPGIHTSALKNEIVYDLNSQKKAKCDTISEDSHYQNVLSSLFNKSNQGFMQKENLVKKSDFIRWEKGVNSEKVELNEVVHQCMLKKMLFEVPFMHSAHSINCRENSTQKDEVCKQDHVPNTNHVLAERRRREKVNERFSTLRSLIPTRSKADKISILDDTITYLKELEKRVEDLESCQVSTTSFNEKKKRKMIEIDEETSDNYGDNNNVGAIKNKGKGGKTRRGEQECGELSIKVSSVDKIITITNSIVDKDTLINISCPWRESLLLQIIDAMTNLHLDSQSVHSSTVDGILSLKIESRVKGSTRVSAEVITETLLRIIRSS